MKKTRIDISKDECYCNLTEFYQAVADRLGIKTTDKTNFDCRKICVTKSVQEILWQYYYDAGDSNSQIATLFLMLGPKANLTGNVYAVEVEDGFIVEETQ